MKTPDTNEVMAQPGASAAAQQQQATEAQLAKQRRDAESARFNQMIVHEVGSP